MINSNLTQAMLIAIGLLCSEHLASAQQYSVNWYKVSGGGGTSTGGVYSVSGTIGQHDTGVSSGGNYTVSGGFWSAVTAVQVEGAPLLSIAYPSPGVVNVSWPYIAGWQLQQSATLAGSPPPWVLVSPTTYQTNSGRVSITTSITPGNLFYRLHKP